MKHRRFGWHREALLREAERLRRSIAAAAVSALLLRSEAPADMGDMAGRSHEEWLFLSQNAQNTELVHEIEEAMQRIDEGTYGICGDCEQAIAPQRLAAAPWAKYCVECQGKRGYQAA